MTKLWLSCFLGYTGILCGAESARSQESEPLVTDRPDFTESTPALDCTLKARSAATIVRVARWNSTSSWS